jgi:HlyD family secretion protein
MKRGIVVLLVVVVVGGALAGGWWWARTQPEQATKFLVDGGLEQSRAEQFVAALGGQAQPQEQETLVASGSIEGESVAIVSEFGGQIVEFNAGEGDNVRKDQILIKLDDSKLVAQMTQAKAGVAAAEANLANVQAGSHPAEILAARAAVLHTQAQLDGARTAWEDAQAILDNPQEIDAQIVQARSSVELAAVQIEQAEAQLASAEVERDKYRPQGSMEEKWMYQVQDYRVQAAQAAIDAAKANEAGAKKTLAALKALRANPLPLVSQVHMAEAQVPVAEAGVAVAKANLAELEAGPTDEEVAVAEAQVAKARAAVTALQIQIDKMTLRSPIEGVVTSSSAHQGEAAIAGATLLTIANLDEVKLTIYIPEDELGRVYLGQEVQVEVDSFSGRTFSGTVSYISQQAEFTPKNVQTEKERVNMVFAVKIRVPNPEHLLKPGMPADAVLDVVSSG